MKSFSKPLFATLILSFMLGIWWGLKTVEEKNQLSEVMNGEVSVVAIKGFFPQEILDEFRQKYQIIVDLDEVDSEFELLEVLRKSGHNYDLVQTYSYQAKSILDLNLVTPKKYSQLKGFDGVSGDFLGLNYDSENQFFLPLSWGINGFMVNGQLVKNIPKTIEELQDMKAYKRKVALLPSPLEVFLFTERKFPSLNTWLKAEKIEQLKIATNEIFDFLSLANPLSPQLADKAQLAFTQMSFSRFTDRFATDQNMTYWVPEDQCVLWVSLLGTSSMVKNQPEAKKFMEYLLDPAVASRWTRLTSQATTLETLNIKDLPEHLTAQYLRQLSLKKINLITEHQAFHPLWAEVLRSHHPQQTE